MTDYRALCAELVQDIEEWIVAVDHCPPSSSALVQRARAALAQQHVSTPYKLPEPVAPTDEELEATARAAEVQNMKEQGGLTASTPDGIHAQIQAQRLAGLRAVAARPTIQPEPVAPTVMEIIELHSWLEDEWRANNDGEDLPMVDYARAVLAKWGNQ
jgi:hypothetical protein